jgi:hypothetical protein
MTWGTDSFPRSCRMDPLGKKVQEQGIFVVTNSVPVDTFAHLMWYAQPPMINMEIDLMWITSWQQPMN